MGGSASNCAALPIGWHCLNTANDEAVNRFLLSGRCGHVGLGAECCKTPVIRESDLQKAIALLDLRLIGRFFCCSAVHIQ